MVAGFAKQIILRTVPGSDFTHTRCNVSPTGQDWSFAAFGETGKLLNPLAPYQEGSWLFTTDELQLDGIEMEDAIHNTRALVDLGTAGRFPEGVDDGIGPDATGKESPSTLSIASTRFPGLADT
jgi:hypothetical protein